MELTSTAAPTSPFGVPPAAMAAWASARGLPAWRGGQVAAWLYARGAGDWEEMTDLPAALRQELAAEGPVLPATIRLSQTSGDGTTRHLLELADGLTVEAVEIPAKGRRTLCLSSQVGCPVGCPFCASGLDGLERSLTSGEVLAPLSLLRAEKFTHVVLMGMGEPLLCAEMPAVLEILCDPNGYGLGRRRVTISTSGVVPKIEGMRDWGQGVRLAISLHAAEDGLRDRLVPLNRKWRIAEVLAAAAAYREATGARITYEYVLLAGVNDRREDARAL
ncbi:23S rRNA (adenine(2503)-C(2))-methyltransferase RlmN, partial [bacterium]|nr:23S rRNA (adenine(2503)-C(2))-methyltransferase RlmN [bacterium]